MSLVPRARERHKDVPQVRQEVAVKPGDPNYNKPSAWLSEAAGKLDCAVQLGAGEEVVQMEKRLDELSAELKKEGR